MRFFATSVPGTRPTDFLHACEYHLEKMEQDSEFRLGVLWVNLGRVDRVYALTSHPDAEKLNGEVLHRAIHVLRSEDRVCLADPEQLWVLLPMLPNSAYAELAAAKLKQALEAPFLLNGHMIQLRPSIGIACCPDHHTEPLGLLSAAEVAATHAYRLDSGYALADTHAEASPESLRALQNELRWALTDNSLQVHYQPQIELRTGQCQSAEALIRWERNSGEWVDAGQIVAMAEAAGMMYSLTMFVLHTVGRQNAELEKAGVKLQFAINLSASMLDDPNLAQAISDVLDIWGIAPQRIIIEVTESSIINDVERAIHRFTELRALGMQLSIDDFGTGYSSLAYLRRFPLNELKIDQVFVRNMLQNPGDDRIVRSVIDLAHNFDLVAVAEGVENAEIEQRLSELGCDITQGYAYSRPLPFDDFKQWMQTHQATEARQAPLL